MLKYVNIKPKDTKDTICYILCNKHIIVLLIPFYIFLSQHLSLYNKQDKYHVFICYVVTHLKLSNLYFSVIFLFILL